MTVIAADRTTTAFPKRTSLVAKVDLVSIKKIDFIDKLISDGANLKLADMRSAVEAYTGLDIYKVDTLWVATGHQDEFIAIMKGKFDTLPVEKALRKLNNYSELKVDGIHYAGVFPDENKPNKNNVLAVLTDDTVMIGEEKFAKEYINVYTRKTKGLDTTHQRRISAISRSKFLAHASTMNFVLPEKEKNNPILKNLKQADLTLDANSKYINVKIDTIAHDAQHAPGIAGFLNGILAKAKKEANRDENPLADDALQNAKISSNSKGIGFQTKLSLRVLEIMLEDQIFGLEKIFE